MFNYSLILFFIRLLCFLHYVSGNKTVANVDTFKIEKFFRKLLDF